MTNSPDNPRLGLRGLPAPWRLDYLEGSGGDTDGGPDSGGSFLERYWTRPDQDGQNHVLVRTDAGIILLNRYPYANGHLLVALGEARPRLLDYTPAQRAALWELVDLSADLLERTLQPQGINIGVNQGVAGGAGVPGHLHVHLVPRWSGDTNFMAVVAQVRVIPASLEAMAARYRRVIDSLRGGEILGPGA